MARPWERSTLCSSIPLTLGMCMSEIKHAVSSTLDDCRNSSAEEKALVSKPNDVTRSCVAAKTEWSSSMIVTIEVV